MKIGVVGAGNIGGTLGQKWASAQHAVFFGVRDPQKASAVQRVQGMDGSVRLGHSADAIAASDVIVFAVPGAAVSAIVDANTDTLAGKIIIDASNNMRGASRHALEELRSKVPTARQQSNASFGLCGRCGNCRGALAGEAALVPFIGLHEGKKIHDHRSFEAADCRELEDERPAGRARRGARRSRH